MEPLPDLVARAAEGDMDAFERIVRRFSRRAVATAHLISGDLHAGEEVAQDAFVTAWRKLGSLKEPAAFPSWFGTILARTASRARRSGHVELNPALEPVHEPLPHSEEGDLPAAAKRLKPMYREALALRYVDGLSYREIADALGLTVARVKSRLHDGRELLREHLARRRDRRK